MGEVANIGTVLVGKPEGTIPVGRRKQRWDDNIRMDPTGIGWEDVNFIHLTQHRVKWRALVNTVMNLRVPYKA
jgi:hypothetical protein